MGPFHVKEEHMKIIVGLGNPGIRYERTRHNAGFLVMDQLSQLVQIPIQQTKFEAKIGIGTIGQERVMLMKPETFMNHSGLALFQAMQYYHLTAKDVLVIYDDIDLPIGTLRLRQKGSAGGHNGIKSVQEALLQQDFDRIRVGVNKDANIPIIKWVLTQFTEPEWKDLQAVLTQAAKAARDWVSTDFVKVMNTYNGAVHG